MELELEKIGKNVLIARTIKGLSQDGLAKQIGMTQSWVQKVEKGEVDLSITTLKKLSVGLGVDPIILISNTPQHIFNNCSLSGNGSVNNCTVNNEELLEKIARLITVIEDKEK